MPMAVSTFQRYFRVAVCHHLCDGRLVMEHVMFVDLKGLWRQRLPVDDAQMSVDWIQLGQSRAVDDGCGIYLSDDTHARNSILANFVGNEQFASLLDVSGFRRAHLLGVLD